jgi:hypothetical protein
MAKMKNNFGGFEIMALGESYKTKSGAQIKIIFEAANSRKGITFTLGKSCPQGTCAF